MDRTIGNPLTFGGRRIGAFGRYIASAVDRLGGARAATMPGVRKLSVDDLQEALRKGVDDFAAFRTDVIFVCLIYPVIGLFLAWAAVNRDLLPLIFPLMAGFTLVGPAAAIGLYEMSRRRERGQDASWLNGFAVIRSPSFGPILVLAVALFMVFIVWMLAAAGIYSVTLGPEAPGSLSVFVNDLFSTSAGWTMIVVGLAVGFVFALIVLAVSVVSFPLLIDRNVGLPIAVATSVRVTAENPGVILLWGLIVALSLAIGSIPALFGLIVIIPVLGHATWHLYRKAVERPGED